MSKRRADLLQGTLDLMVLKTLRQGPLHGWGISKRIRQTSRGVLEIRQGSLYPALYRLEDKGWIAGEEGVSPEGRQVKQYSLTRNGLKQLSQERATWTAFSAAVNHVLEAT